MSRSPTAMTGPSSPNGTASASWRGASVAVTRCASTPATRPLLRYFPELEGPLRALPPGCVVDGEVVVITDGVLDFDALSAAHPSGRVPHHEARHGNSGGLRRLRTCWLPRRGPARRRYRERRERLVALASTLDDPWHLTPSTTDRATAERWFEEFEAAGCDGIVAKRLDDRYVEGERQMLKIKHRRSVGRGRRRLPAAQGRRQDRRAAARHVRRGRRAPLRRAHLVVQRGRSHGHAWRVPALEAESSFGEEARRPEHEHRWSGQRIKHWVPVQPIVVAEVSHDQITGRRFRHASRFLRWRPDKDAADCRLDQLDVEAGRSFADVVSER